AGTFTDIQAPLPTGQWWGSFASWADYDNDGDLDLLLAHSSGVYRNDGSDTFVLVDDGFPAVQYGDASWADDDNDGDLDIAFRAGSDGPIGILQSHGANPNALPTTPPHVESSLAGLFLTLTFDPSQDAQTPVAGLSYNVRVGTTPGGNEALPGMAGTDGFRRVVRAGNAGERLSRTIQMPGLGKYYWSVQAIDGSYAGSAFTAEESVFVGTQVIPSF